MARLLRGAFYQARAQARRGFWRGAAPLNNKPAARRDGRKCQEGHGIRRKGVYFILWPHLFPPQAADAQNKGGAAGEGIGDGGRATGEHGDNRAVAKQARPRKRGFPEPAL